MEYPKIVEFEKYCKKCTHFKKAEDEAPCSECLAIPVRDASHKPEFFKEAKRR